MKKILSLALMLMLASALVLAASAEVPTPWFDLEFVGGDVADAQGNATPSINDGEVTTSTVVVDGEEYEVLGFRGDASSEYIEVSLPFANAEELGEHILGGSTIEVTIQFDNQVEASGQVACGLFTSCYGGGYSLYYLKGKSDFYIGSTGAGNFNSGKYFSCASIDSFKFGEVMQVTGVYSPDDECMYLYENGEIMGALAHSGDFGGGSALSSSLGIGVNISETSESVGRRTPYTVVDARLYKVALTEEQVLERWEETKEAITSGAAMEEGTGEVGEKVEKKVVVCVGDSVTYGASASVGMSYPAQMGKILGGDYRIMNAGASGAGAQIGDNINWGPGNFSYITSDKYTAALEAKPNIVVIMLGCNDAYSLSKDDPSTLDTFYNSLKQIGEAFEALETKPEIYLVGTPYRNDIAERTVNLRELVLPLQKKLALDKGWKFLDLFAITENAIVTEGKDYLSDGVHYNDEGYGFLAQHIGEFVKTGVGTTIDPSETAIGGAATEAPATEAPATEAPATEAPATEAPATEAPATEAPATEAPATEAPATEAPATQAPATEAPATQAPATEAPATQAPSEVVDQAAQTFDFGVIAAVAAVVSLAGYAVAKKH